MWGQVIRLSSTLCLRLEMLRVGADTGTNVKMIVETYGDSTIVPMNPEGQVKM